MPILGSRGILSSRGYTGSGIDFNQTSYNDYDWTTNANKDEFLLLVTYGTSQLSGEIETKVYNTEDRFVNVAGSHTIPDVNLVWQYAVNDDYFAFQGYWGDYALLNRNTNSLTTDANVLFYTDPVLSFTRLNGRVVAPGWGHNYSIYYGNNYSNWSSSFKSSTNTIGYSGGLAYRPSTNTLLRAGWDYQGDTVGLLRSLDHGVSWTNLYPSSTGLPADGAGTTINYLSLMYVPSPIDKFYLRIRFTDNSQKLYSSTDGIGWTTLGTISGTRPNLGLYTQTDTSIRYYPNAPSDKKFVSTTTGGNFLYSGDCLTWYENTLPSSNSQGYVASGGYNRIRGPYLMSTGEWLWAGMNYTNNNIDLYRLNSSWTSSTHIRSLGTPSDPSYIMSINDGFHILHANTPYVG